MGTILHGEVERAVEFINDPAVDISATNKDGVSALMFCFGKREYGLAELLLEKGADVTAQNKDGVSALMLALTTVHEEGTRQKLVSMLIERGADIVELSKSNVKAQQYLDQQTEEAAAASTAEDTTSTQDNKEEL